MVRAFSAKLPYLLGSVTEAHGTIGGGGWAWLRASHGSLIAASFSEEIGGEERGAAISSLSR